jgi:radical SAM protein with 4Fe4S-binding SPASM domain
MTTDQVLAVINQIADAGCLFLLLTGGEPLLRDDFEAIYREAKRKGLLVTVFTNGTLITQQVLNLFEDWPPRAVEVTLHGATAATYERITGVRGSYERCLRGVEALLEHGVNTRLKTVLMTANRDEYFAIKAMAEDYGLPFRFDAAIFARVDGDKAPLRLRVPPREVVENEFADEERAGRWIGYLERFEASLPSDALYQCGAGVNTFHVDPYGQLQPCLMASAGQHDLLTGDFSVGWEEVVPEIRQRRLGSSHRCSSCAKRLVCGFCPPFFALENGAEDVPSEYLCAIGQLRWRAIREARKGVYDFGQSKRH